MSDDARPAEPMNDIDPIARLAELETALADIDAENDGAVWASRVGEWWLRIRVVVHEARVALGAARAEVDALRATFRHCERCGGSWVDDGLQGECYCSLIAALRAGLADAKGLISGVVLASIMGLKPIGTAEAEVNRVVDKINALLSASAPPAVPDARKENNHG